jgi:hypothetical protein
MSGRTEQEMVDRSMTKSARLSKAIILAIVVIMLAPGTSQAYSTRHRWPQTQRSVTYWVYTDLSDKLFPNGGSQAGQTKVVNAIVDSAHQWNISSGFKFHRTTSFVERHWDAYDLMQPNWFAIVIPTTSGGTNILTRARTVFNNGPQFTWFTDGTMGPRSGGGWRADVYKVALHEWGHWIFLQDYPENVHNYPDPNNLQANAVMWIDTNGAKPWLLIDDKEGAVMTYGIETGFSESQFLGLYPNVPPSPNQNVGTYLDVVCGATTGGSPDYWTYNAGEDGIGELGNGKGRYMRFRGCAKSSSSVAKAYMTLAGNSHAPGGDGPGAQGASCGFNCYQQIQSGMNLRWLQRNAQGCAAFISLEFTDGTFLHSSQYNVVDTAGRRLTAVDRCTHYPVGPPTGGYFIQIRFSGSENSTVLNKTIKRYIVVYDNTGNVKNER